MRSPRASTAPQRCEASEYGDPETGDGAVGAAGAVVRADAVLYPRGVVARPAPVQGVARYFHRRRSLFHAATQECPAPRVAPGGNPARRLGDPRRGQRYLEM